MARKARVLPARPVELPPRWPADKVERRLVADLVPYARNSRSHSLDQVEQICASIREFGWTIPVLVAEDGTIIAGHGRVLAAKHLGIEEVPVMVAIGWSDEQRRAYTIADNALTDASEFDDDVLRLEVADLFAASFDVGLLGFNDKELDRLLAAHEAGDDDAEAYTRTIKAPIYEPKGDMPAPAELYNDSRVVALVREIDDADLPSDVAAFLKLAAARHAVFDFRRIADFYASAPVEVQRLMERSALVIIDFGQAIENGFVKLTKRLGDMASNSEPASQEEGEDA